MLTVAKSVLNSIVVAVLAAASAMIAAVNLQIVRLLRPRETSAKNCPEKS
jgi:hypothetical protein